MRFLILLAAGLAIVGARAARAQAPADADAMSAWIVPWDMQADTQALACFGEIRPFALGLSSAPALDRAYPKLLGTASGLRRKGIRVVPAVVNDVFAGGRLQTLKSDRAVAELLSDPRAMAAHIADLAALARDYDGVEIDYERIPPPAWPLFVDFIARLAVDLHRGGKSLSIDVESGPLYRGDLARRYWPVLARAVDGINLMDYYEHTGLAWRPGAGSSLAWTVETARRALEFVPSEKLAVAVSLAGTDWAPVLAGPAPGWRGARLNYGQVMKLLDESQAAVEWDDASATPHFHALRDGVGHEVWFENERSVGEKIRALRRIGIKRYAVWYWGRRHPDPRASGLCRD